MKAPQLLPTVPMSRYGTNPYGEVLYRVVFSDSRTDLLGGRWPDGRCEYREVPRYPAIKAQWILEKWLSAEDYAGPKDAYEREQWDADSHLLTCGPYPNRGEYAHCYTFPFAPGDGMVMQVITALRRSRDVTAGQRKRGILDPLEKQQRDWSTRFDEIYGNAQGAWSHADAVMSMAQPSWQHKRAGFKRGADMQVRTDQSAPLPTQDNFFGQIRRQETIAALTGEQNADSQP